MTDELSRRDFIRKTALGTLALGLAPTVMAAEPLIPRRAFGATGMQLSILGLGGGSQFLAAGDANAPALLEKALALGINYFDTAAQYGDRKSEKIFGQVLPPHRANIHIGSKSLDRTYDGAMRSVEETLKNLKTDHLDIFHVHAVAPADKVQDWGKPEGVVTALRKLRDQKVIRSMALSGHDSPEKLKEAIEMYDFNSVLMAVNATQKKAFREVALPAAQKKNMGIIAMKTSRGLIGEGEGKAKPSELLHWAWDQPLHVAIVGMGTIAHLEENVGLAKAYKPGKAEDKLVARLYHVTDEQLGWSLPGHVDA